MDKVEYLDLLSDVELHLDAREFEDALFKLNLLRNKLNRQISTLKKAQLKE